MYLKGVTLRARDASPDMLHSLNLVVDELARQVKRHRDKRRHRREAQAAPPAPPARDPGGDSAVGLSYGAGAPAGGGRGRSGA